MLLRRALPALLLAAASCSGSSSHETTTPSANVVAVPLTNASAQQLAYQQQETDLTPPFSLTASDGSGLQLSRIEAKAVSEGPLAFTELHLYFHNGEARQREGTFAITLPQGAAVSRFAMETNGQMVEAEVVDKMVARRAYDDFLHRKQDPALLEKGAGNQFTAKVFPIAPNADKHIVISFSQALPGAPYVLPLRGLPKTERVDATLSILAPDGTRSEQTLSERNWKPDKDFISNAVVSAGAVMAGNLIAAQVAIGGENADTQAQQVNQVTLLVDTSASRAAGYARYLKSVRQLVGALGEKYGAQLPIEVIAFDQDTQSIYKGPANGYTEAQDKMLFERGAAGASDLERALDSIPPLPDRAQNVMRNVLVVTDGVMTAGGNTADVVARAKQLDHVARIDVALAGGIRDEAMAGQLVTAAGHAGAVLDLDGEGPAAVASALSEAVMLNVAVDVPGAAWVYPKTLPTARAGHRAVVFARMAKQTQSVEITVGGAKTSTGAIGVAPALLGRAVASAEIDELEAKLTAASGDEAKALKAEIGKRSVAARVVSSQTAMLVLESDADYARYHIDRTALADILVVGKNGVEQTHRASAVIAAPEPVAKTTKPPLGKDTVEKEKAKELRKELQEGKEDNKPVEIADKNVDTGADVDGVEGGVEGGVVGGELGGVVAQKLDVTPDPEKMEPKKPDEAPRDQAPPPPPAAPRVERPAADLTRANNRQFANRARGRAEPQNGSGWHRGDVSNDDGEALEQQGDQWPPKDAPAALSGTLAEVEKAIADKKLDAALETARAWHDKDPGDVLALIALGDALEARHADATAARVYGSIIDLFPGRADLRRFAGERLERIGQAPRWLAVDTYKKAVEDRPDHLTGHRLLAYALLRDGKPAEAFAAILAGIEQKYPEGRFLGGDRVLAEDAGMIGAAYAKAEPGKKKEIEAALAKHGTKLATTASTRFILYWETDGNDVDFHIKDAKGHHAFFSNPTLASGGSLYADITTGYGPECFAIEGTPKAGPYQLSINYYSQGPMGYGMGLLEVQRFDGKGGLTFEDRPYVIMTNQAYVDLGSVK